MDAPRTGRRIIRVALLVTAAASTVFGALALADLLIGTAFWPENVEYGPQLLFFGWVFYQMRSEGERVKRWEWVAVPCLVGCVWLLVAAAYTNPEGVLTILALFFMLVGLAFGLGGKYGEWANPRPRTR